jgi:hypothetical protein
MSEGVKAVDSFVQGTGEQYNLDNKDIEMMRFNDRKNYGRSLVRCNGLDRSLDTLNPPGMSLHVTQ